jgi:hypothetical protein
MFLKEMLFLDKFKTFKSKHVNLDIFDLIQILEMQIKLFFFFIMDHLRVISPVAHLAKLFEQDEKK